MAGTLLFIHLAAAAIWVGGHLVLAIGLLPEALAKRDPEPIREFERVYEQLGLPAMAIQVITGLWLARRLLPEMAAWMDWSNPVARTIDLKIACLAATLALAVHARLRVVPTLNADRLPLLGVHIIAVTTLALVFVWLGVCFRYGGV
ncbi:MAG: copper resistance protein CopD [Candidatus Synechococcus spongiarum 142]|uniref:Copper resistance protein CopD n=1 Tax=Candidatus Synechococcus spongiarum 142 TaxID=1608213 RepID=A0A6N3XA60_9SYNE|nr:MAG: copper resistance protein CopD [Candidatus Synechococcus spongiarum 142]